MELLETLQNLASRLEGFAGGRTALLIHCGAAVAVLLVVGKLLARLVFRSDAGHLPTLLASLLPLLLGILVWAASVTWFNPDLFSLQSHQVDLALLLGVLVLLLPGPLLAARLISTGWAKSLLFLVLVYAASAGGVLISHASLTVFGSGSTQMEKAQDRLNLD